MRLKKEKKENKNSRRARVGEYSFRRKYTPVQIIIDIASLAALVYIGYIIYICKLDIEKIKQLNRTEADMSMFVWEPLLIWAGVGVLIFAASFFLIFRKKKKPGKYLVTKNNVVRYCNIIDTCIAGVRLVLIISLWEACYLHMSVILMRQITFSPQLLLDAAIIVGILVITRMRLRGMSDEEEGSASSEKKKEIVQD